MQGVSLAELKELLAHSTLTNEQFIGEVVALPGSAPRRAPRSGRDRDHEGHSVARGVRDGRGEFQETKGLIEAWRRSARRLKNAVSA